MLTTRDTMMKTRENINLDRKQMQEWGVYAVATPTKRIKSVTQLKKRCQEFLDSHKPDDMLTVNQLAIFLGYPSEKSIIKEINNPTVPEYSAVLERYVGLIQDTVARKMLEIADETKQWKGFAAYLERQDLISSKSEEDISKNQNIDIKVQLEHKASAALEESLSALLNLHKASAVEAEVVEIEPVALIEENPDG